VGIPVITRTKFYGKKYCLRGIKKVVFLMIVNKE